MIQEEFTRKKNQKIDELVVAGIGDLKYEVIYSSKRISFKLKQKVKAFYEIC